MSKKQGWLCVLIALAVLPQMAGPLGDVQGIAAGGLFILAASYPIRIVVRFFTAPRNGADLFPKR